jgi:beta-mannosidase
MNRGTCVSGRTLLDTGWQLIALPAGTYSNPEDLPTDGWIETPVPSTAAQSLQMAGLWSLDDPPRRFDAQDWWYRLRFAAGGPANAVLELEGLATVADVWLNRTHVLHGDNMFLGYVVPVQVCSDNHLVIRFAALDAELHRKRPRPRWRVPMIEHQQLRWFRTTLLGRTPGWSPPAAPVGPWRPISLLIDAVRAPAVHVHVWLHGSTGYVKVSCAADASNLALTISGHGIRHEAKFHTDALGKQSVTVRVEDPALWWPHTHGTPERYALSLSFSDTTGNSHSVALRSIGFRHITLETRDNSFALRVNGEAVFCRGACWTPIDVVSLSASEARYVAAIQQAVDAGMNMLRVSGTTIYETDVFYETCDRLGMLIWQDFMFANMDFPAEDTAFVDSVRKEAEQFLHRVAGRPCLAILCGNSEVEQQAAMCGAPREYWQPTLFHQLLRDLVHECAGGVSWWPSSAHGGNFPHQPRSGTTSYYGLGAYLRSLDDVRTSDVRFATECLALANIPEPETLRAMPGGLLVKSHHPVWKQRSPRDLGAGWDFDDVRDFYFTQLFKLDPMQLRYSDHDRYLQLSRVVSGELMQYAFSQWRRMNSRCGGALIWFMRDLWPGAGWGVVGSDGTPKAPLYFLRRALRPVNVHITKDKTGCLCI